MSMEQRANDEKEKGISNLKSNLEISNDTDTKKNSDNVEVSMQESCGVNDTPMEG